MPINKTHIGIISGIAIIISVGLLMGLPFVKSEIDAQQLPHNDEKLQEAEKKMFELIEQERAELASKIGGKITP